MDIERLIEILVPIATGFLGAVFGFWSQAFATRKQWEHDRQTRREEREQAKADAEAQRIRDASFAVLELAELFEAYAMACADVIATNAHIDSPYDHGLAVTIPNLPAFPEVDWKVIGIRTTSEVRALASEVKLIRASLSDILDHLDAVQAADEASERAGKLGQRVWNLAVALRSTHGLPQFDVEKLPWNFLSTIELHLERLEENRRDATASPDGL